MSDQVADRIARAETVTLGRAPGIVLDVLTLGATLQRLEIDAHGGRRDVLVGLPGAAQLLATGGYLGPTIGRYANRIAGGRFAIDGVEHAVPPNDRGNALHGGADGFDRRLWEVVEASESSVLLRLVSPDGDQGFPGELTADARFAVAADRVVLELSATTTRPTIVNLTSHAYLNLDGAGSADEHLLGVPASSYTPTDAVAIPVGDHAPVAGTPFDLRDPRPIGEVVRSPHEQMLLARGIDHNFVVDGTGLRQVATLESRRSRLVMELWSDQPCVQVYTGNGLDGTVVGRTGSYLRQGDGVALEPQLAPDTPNHPEWPSAVLRPGQTYASRIEWRFRAS